MRKRAEVVIVGSGGFGASTAYHLARRGVRDVILLDRYDLGSQTSPRAAGLTSKVAALRAHGEARQRGRGDAGRVRERDGTLDPVPSRRRHARPADRGGGSAHAPRRGAGAVLRGEGRVPVGRRGRAAGAALPRGRGPRHPVLAGGRLLPPAARRPGVRGRRGGDGRDPGAGDGGDGVRPRGRADPRCPDLGRRDREPRGRRRRRRLVGAPGGRGGHPRPDGADPPPAVHHRADRGDRAASPDRPHPRAERVHAARSRAG